MPGYLLFKLRNGKSKQVIIYTLQVIFKVTS